MDNNTEIIQKFQDELREEYPKHEIYVFQGDHTLIAIRSSTQKDFLYWHMMFGCKDDLKVNCIKRQIEQNPARKEDGRFDYSWGFF